MRVIIKNTLLVIHCVIDASVRLAGKVWRRGYDMYKVTAHHAVIVVHNLVWKKRSHASFVMIKNVKSETKDKRWFPFQLYLFLIDKGFDCSCYCKPTKATRVVCFVVVSIVPRRIFYKVQISKSSQQWKQLIPIRFE